MQGLTPGAVPATGQRGPECAGARTSRSRPLALLSQQAPRAGFQATRLRPREPGGAGNGRAAAITATDAPCSPRPGPAPTVTSCQTLRAFPVAGSLRLAPARLGLGAALALRWGTEPGGPARSSCRARPAPLRGTAPTQHARRTALLRPGTRPHEDWPLGAFGQGLPRAGQVRPGEGAWPLGSLRSPRS